MGHVAVDIDRVRADIERLKRELNELEAFERRLVAYSTNGTSATPPATKVSNEPVVTTTLVRKSEIEDAAVHDAVRLVLERAKRPMRVPEIAAALSVHGYKDHVASLKNMVFRTLSRRPDLFERASQPLLWELAEEGGGAEPEDKSIQ